MTTDKRTEWQRINDALQAGYDMGHKKMRAMPVFADTKCRYCGKDIRQWEGGVWRHWDGYAECEDEKHSAEPKEEK